MNTFYILISSGLGFYGNLPSLKKVNGRPFYNGVTDSIYLAWE